MPRKNVKVRYKGEYIGVMRNRVFKPGEEFGTTKAESEVFLATGQFELVEKPVKKEKPEKGNKLT